MLDELQTRRENGDTISLENQCAARHRRCGGSVA